MILCRGRGHPGVTLKEEACIQRQRNELIHSTTRCGSGAERRGASHFKDEENADSFFAYL